MVDAVEHQQAKVPVPPVPTVVHALYSTPWYSKGKTHSEGAMQSDEAGMLDGALVGAFVAAQLHE